MSLAAPHTSDDLDGMLLDLADGEKRWSQTQLKDRAEILHHVAVATLAQAQAWVDAACRAKKLPPSSPLAGEEWLSGPYAVAMNASTLSETVAAIGRGESPLANIDSRAAPGDRTALHVFPRTKWDRLLMSGFSADVWLRPGTARAEALATAGLGQLTPEETDGTAVVLGAGNITSIAVLDTLYEVVAHNRAVLLKLNPVMDEMLEVTRAVLAPLVEIGLVHVVTGGIEVGSYLVDHPAVTHVHITGSSLSHDAIVFGTGEEGARRKAAGEVRLSKSITSELGGVSPTIIVPGGWSRRDIRFQAEHVATQRLHNGGYNCIASQVVVVPGRWAQKEQFLSALREQFDHAPARTPYYPGSDDRVAAAREAHATSVDRRHGRLLVEALGPDDQADVFQVEYFSPVLGVVEIDGEGSAYLEAAEKFVNLQLAGTLGANILVHPKTRRRLGDVFTRFLESLRYGTVGVNAWTAVGYLTAAAPWGGYPGATLTQVGSGIGVVHNALLIDKTEKTVVTGPFRPLSRSLATGQWSITPKPAWFVRNRSAATTGKRLVEFIAQPSWRKLPRVFASALRG